LGGDGARRHRLRRFPARLALLAALQGALFGIFPIMYIPFGSLVASNVLKATG